MYPEKIDWDSGEVTYWDLAFLDPLKPLVDQIDSLKEDLAQVRYANEVILDVGWYPEFSASGRFVIRIVRESNWDEPLFLSEYATIDAFLTGLKATIQVAKGNSL